MAASAIPDLVTGIKDVLARSSDPDEITRSVATLAAPLARNTSWGVAPHDHQTWGVVIGLEGEERNVMWRREDDGSKPGYAKLANAGETVVRNGDICRLLPDEIHSVRNESDELSMSLHIYGRNLAHVDRSEFDPINSVQRPCPVRKRTE